MCNEMDTRFSMRYLRSSTFVISRDFILRCDIHVPRMIFEHPITLLSFLVREILYFGIVKIGSLTN